MVRDRGLALLIAGLLGGAGVFVMDERVAAPHELHARDGAHRLEMLQDGLLGRPVVEAAGVDRHGEGSKCDWTYLQRPSAPL
eukprot:13138958-Alexandrium_andersonii.AAC.1